MDNIATLLSDGGPLALRVEPQHLPEGGPIMTYQFPSPTRGALLLLGLAFGAALPAAAQYDSPPKFFLEGLAGAAVPTFDIAKTAKIGSMVGGAIGVHLNPRLVLMGEFDYGMHKDKATGTVDINTLHYMAKLGYMLTKQNDKGWEAMVNLGAGAMSFEVGSGAASSTKTYFAINAGAKLSYNFNRTVAFVLSPQGDIAFTKKADLNTTNAWVWPIAAGLRIRY